MIADFRQRVSAVACICHAGDVMLMRPLLLHASSVARSPGIDASFISNMPVQVSQADWNGTTGRLGPLVQATLTKETFNILLIRGVRCAAVAPVPLAATWRRGRLLVALLTIATCMVLTLWGMDRKVRSQAEGLQNEAREVMLSASPPRIGDLQNAALVYRAAFARIDSDMTSFRGRPLFPHTPDETDPAAAELLNRHEPTIALLRKAGSMPGCRFEHDYSHPSRRMPRRNFLPRVSRPLSCGWTRVMSSLLGISKRPSRMSMPSFK